MVQKKPKTTNKKTPPAAYSCEFKGIGVCKWELEDGTCVCKGGCIMKRIKNK